DEVVGRLGVARDLGVLELHDSAGERETRRARGPLRLEIREKEAGELAAVRLPLDDVEVAAQERSDLSPAGGVRRVEGIRGRLDESLRPRFPRALVEQALSGGDVRELPGVRRWADVLVDVDRRVGRQAVEQVPEELAEAADVMERGVETDEVVPAGLELGVVEVASEESDAVDALLFGLAPRVGERGLGDVEGVHLPSDADSDRRALEGAESASPRHAPEEGRRCMDAAEP